MMGEKTVKTFVFLSTATLILTSLPISIQGCSGCSPYYVAVLNEQNTDNDGLAGNITIAPIALPLWFQIVAFPPRSQPLYDLLVKNYNNRSIDCYVKQELTDKQGKILLTYNESYTIQPYEPGVASGPVIPIMKYLLMERDFKTGFFEVYVEVFVPEDSSTTNVSFNGFYFHGFSLLFRLQYYQNFYRIPDY
ncbi:MAG TPA: hypothetical protein ENI45_01890 [Thermoplasmatales archaeon]|nr:hypothetical protein [Thermoplasmatales archaeon]